MLGRRVGGFVVLTMLAASAVACGRPAGGQVVVPNLVGTSRDAAKATLAAVGLRYQVVVQQPALPCPVHPGMVIAQNPRGGTPALAWTVVMLTSYPSVPRAVTGTACAPPP